MATDVFNHLSPYFTIAEMTATQVRGVDNTPNDEQIQNLARLCREILEPIREKFGPVHINSGYRSKELNERIGGSSKTSMHMQGCAADFFCTRATLADVYKWIASSHLEYDQLIFEFGRWLHIGIRPTGVNLRRENLVIFEPGKYEKYDSKIHDLGAKNV